MSSQPLRMLHLTADAPLAAQVAHEIDRAGLHATVQLAATADEYRRQLREFAPDAVLADDSVPQCGLRRALTDLRTARPALPLIMVARAVEEGTLVDLLRAGMENYVLAGRLQRLGPVVQSALAVRAPLKQVTARQLEVLQFMVDGVSTRTTAERLKLSVKTIETHRAELMRRLGIRDLPGLVRYAVRVGLIAVGA